MGTRGRVTCRKCGYTWTARVAHPKSCPECKARLRPRKYAELRDKMQPDVRARVDARVKETIDSTRLLKKPTQ